MSVAAGVLMYSSLYTLLPAANTRLQFTPLPLFFAGVLLNLLLSRLVHFLTPKQLSGLGDEENSKLLNPNNQRQQADIENYGASTLRQPHDQPQADSVTASGFLQIGIQTTVAMCLHKLPEGIITFVSSSGGDSSVGFTVFCAISLHNFTDGVMIALPLYAATQSTWMAFSYGACMGGVSQILGGVFGVLAVTNLNQQYEDIFIGIVFAVVSGMMCLIAIQVCALFTLSFILNGALKHFVI
ncbi:Zinc transporter, variant 3 [Umbelopsis sp. WA50703]